MLTALLLALAADFRAVDLHGGGEVIVRHGPEARARLREGDARYTRIGTAGGRLAIVNCPERCPHRYRPVVEVSMPALDALSVSDGGLIRSEGGFPGQSAVEARVDSGGAVDIRTLSAAEVTASVAQGGMIFTRPGRRLDARIEQGGAITYWGRPAVTRSIRHGGVVQRGADRDLDKPLAAFNPEPPPVPPPVPPVPNLFLNRR